MAVVTGYKHIFMRLMWEKGRERNNSLSSYYFEDCLVDDSVHRVRE